MNPQGGARALAAAEGILLATLVASPFAFACVPVWASSLLQATVVLIFLLCVTAECRRPTSSAHLLPLAIVAYIGLVAIAQLANPHPVTDPTGWPFLTASSFGTHQGLLRWASFGTLAYSMPTLLQRSGAANRVMRAALASGVLVAAVGVLQKLQGNHLILWMREPLANSHPFGPFGNYNHAACWLNLSFFLGCGAIIPALMRGNTSSSLPDRAEWGAKAFTLMSLLSLILAGIIHSGSRGGLLSWLAASAAGAGTVAWAAVPASRLRRAALLALIAGGTGAAFFVWRHPNLVGNIFGTPDGSTATRLSIYRSTLQLIIDFPLLGSGFGAFRTAFSPYQEIWEHKYFVSHAHSDALELIAGVGLVGALPALLFGAYLLFVPPRALTKLRTSDAQVRLGAMWCAMMALAIHSQVDFNLQIPALAFYAAVISFALNDRLAEHNRMPWVPLDARPKILLASLALFMITANILPLYALWMRNRAETAPAVAAPRFLKRALNAYGDPHDRFLLAKAYMRLSGIQPNNYMHFVRESIAVFAPAYEAAPWWGVNKDLMGTTLWWAGRKADGSMVGWAGVHR